MFFLSAGVEEYFEGVHERYGGRPMVIVNLLRCDTESGETALSETFQQSLREARTRLETRGGKKQELVMCNFDWHRLKKELGMDMSVKGLWERLTPHLEASGLTEGTWETGGAAGFNVERHQANVLRFNCLDSLDRTNICCFMVAQQVCLEQCRRVGKGIVEQAAVMFVSSLNERQKDWVYLHNLGLTQVRSVLHARVLEWVAEAFVRNGDVFSHLYTNTPALLTNVMREYTSLPMQQSDLVLTTQRRFENVLKDAERQFQYNLFLGRHLSTLLPCQTLPSPGHIFSHPGGFLVRVPPSEVAPPPDAYTSILDMNGPGDAAWVSPKGVKEAEVVVSLRQPCQVSHVQVCTRTPLGPGLSTLCPKP